MTSTEVILVFWLPAARATFPTPLISLLALFVTPIFPNHSPAIPMALFEDTPLATSHTLPVEAHHTPSRVLPQVLLLRLALSGYLRKFAEEYPPFQFDTNIATAMC